MTHPCKGCVDASRIYGTRQYVCDFLLHTGRARSLICPPGAACTMKSTKPRSLDDIKPETRGRRICWDTQMGMWLYQQGLSDSEIARRVGTTRQCVRAWRVRRGLTTNKA